MLYRDVNRKYWNVFVSRRITQVRNFYAFIQNLIKLVLPRSEGIYEMQIFFGCHNIYVSPSKMH